MPSSPAAALPPRTTRSDTVPGSTASTATIAPGTSVAGTLDSLGDHDWYRVTLVAGTSYVFGLSAAGSGVGTLADPILRLRDASGTLVASDDDGGTGRDSLLAITTSASGTFFLDAGAFFDGGTGSFLLSVALADAVEGSTATSASIAEGESVLGSVDSGGDADWYAVFLEEGVSYDIALSGADGGGGSLADPFLGIRDAAGTLLLSDDDSGTGLDAALSVTVNTGGLYYLDSSGFGSQTGTFTLSLDRADLVAGDTSTSGRLQPGDSLAGTVEAPGDEDWYRIVLLAGETYEFRLLGFPSGNGTLADPFLRLLDATGTRVAQDDDSGSGTESFLRFTADARGVFYVSAEGFGTGTGTYLLTAERLSDAIAENTTTNARIRPGQQRSSAIETAGDEDWFAIDLRAGQTYTIELLGDLSTGSPLADPFLRGIHDATGRLIAGTANDDYGGTYNAQVTFTAGETARHYISAGAFGSFTGSYILSVETLGGGSPTGGDSVADDAAGAGAVAPGATGEQGSIDFARDIDWFRVRLVEGVRYEINLLGAPTGDGTLTDPLFWGVHDAAGNVIAGTADDDSGTGTNSRTFFTPEETGFYFLAAAGYYNFTGTYLLTVERTGASSEVPDDVTTDAVLPVGRFYDGEIETAGDVDWIRVRLAPNRAYEVELSGTDSGGGTLSDPFIEGIYDAAGNAIPDTSDHDGGTGGDALVTFTAPERGVYYVAAASDGSATGTYKLQVRTGTDDEAPRIVTFEPADGATGVGSGGPLTLTFGEAVEVGAGRIILRGGGAVQRIDISDTSQVTVRGSTVTIDPASGLADNANYTVRLARGLVEDRAGNAFEGAPAWNFRTGGGTPPSGESWTIMVYIAGDNNLEPFAISDLNEMESVNLPGSVNVATLVDRAPGFSTASGNWTDTRQGTIAFDGTNPTVTSLSSASTSIGERNSGDGQTLTDFIDWAARTNPADRYMLVIWDHGAGTLGSAWDDSSNGDNLSLREMREAVEASTVDRFDIIGFDACLMAVVEQASEIAGIADVLVASEELEPGDGWAYDRWLDALRRDPDLSAEALAREMVRTYGEEYAGQSDITLSATRLSAMGTLETRLDTFVTRALAASSGDVTAMRTAADRAVALPSDQSFDFADLGDFMAEVAAGVSDGALRNAANGVVTALNQAVFATSGTVSGATGLGIYLPFGSEPVDRNYRAGEFAFLDRVDWDDFLAIL